MNPRSPVLLPTSEFLYATCRIGAEPALKAEVPRRHPGLRPSFSRPGFVTFRSDTPLRADFDLEATFARRWGLSFGKTTVDETLSWLDAHWPGRSPRLHAWARGTDADDEVLATEVEASFRATGRFAAGEAAQRRELVVDVIEVDPGQLWLGTHTHGTYRSPFAGGRIPLTLPDDVPSRAWRKLEEALVWGPCPMKAGDRVLEFGCSPGGATYAMLTRGMEVWGVDPAPMHPAVAGFGDRFHHHAAPIGAFARDRFPEAIDWFVVDLGIAPQRAIRAMQRFFPPYRRSLKGVLWTLKLNDWAFADEIPRWREQLEQMGLETIRFTQLPAHRQECFVYGLTRRGAVERG